CRNNTTGSGLYGKNPIKAIFPWLIAKDKKRARSTKPLALITPTVSRCSRSTGYSVPKRPPVTDQRHKADGQKQEAGTFRSRTVKRVDTNIPALSRCLELIGLMI